MSSDDESMQREARFNAYVERLNTQPCDLPLRCPCCYCKTLSKRADFEICEVCFWEDDGQDDYDADIIRECSPNGRLSLTVARQNYRKFGACEENMLENVRPPSPQELAD